MTASDPGARVQQLHLVGYTTDLKQLTFSTRRGAKNASYTIALDETLLQAIDDALKRGRSDGDPERLGMYRRHTRAESSLSPREIQSRLRAGRALAEIADDAGVDVEWIARFAAPILAEQAQVITRALELTYSTPRKGPSGRPLGTSVRWNVADRGVRLSDDEFDAGWSAHQLRDGTWVLRFEFVSRRHPQVAEWEVDPDTGDVAARNRLGSALGYVEARARPPAAELLLGTIPPVAPPPPETEAGEDDPAPTTRTKKVRPAKRSPKKAAKKSPAKKSPAKKNPTRKGPAKRAAGRATPAKRTPAKKAAKRSVTRAAPKKSASRRPAVKKAAAKKAAKKKVAPKKVGARKRAAAKKVTGRKAARKARPVASPATSPAPVPRRVRRSSSPRVTFDDVAVAVGHAPASTEARPGDLALAPATPRVVTIRADRAVPPTQSQLDVVPDARPAARQPTLVDGRPRRSRRRRRR